MNVIDFSLQNMREMREKCLHSMTFSAGKIIANIAKDSVEKRIFDYIALHIGCRFNKNSLFQRYFLVFLLAGKSLVVSLAWLWEYR